MWSRLVKVVAPITLMRPDSMRALYSFTEKVFTCRRSSRKLIPPEPMAGYSSKSTMYSSIMPPAAALNVHASPKTKGASGPCASSRQMTS